MVETLRRRPHQHKQDLRHDRQLLGPLLGSMSRLRGVFIISVSAIKYLRMVEYVRSVDHLPHWRILIRFILTSS